MPTTDIVTVNPGGGADYTSLSAAIDAEARDLTASDEIVIFRCSGATADTTQVTAANWDGFVCDATRYIQIEPASGQEHGGAWNTGVYRLEVTDANAVDLPSASATVFHIRFRGLQIRAIATTGTTVRRAIAATSGITLSSPLDIQNCILRVSKTGGTGVAHVVVRTADSQWTPLTIGNTLLLLDGTDVGDGFRRATSILSNVYIHNCGVAGATIAYNDEANSTTGTVQVKNSWSFECGAFSGGAGIENSDYNSTDLASATGGANDRVLQTFTFVDEPNGDYRPANTDTAIRGFGVDLSGDANLAITTDMEGNAVNSPPDIGPLKAEAPGAGGGSGAAQRPRGSFMTQFYKNEQTAARRRLPLWLVQSDGTTPASFEGGTPLISINGGAYYAAAAAISSVTTGIGEYYAQLAASDLSVVGRGRLLYSSATVGKADADFMIVDTNPYDSGLVSQNTLLTGGTTSSVTLASGETTTNDVFNGSFILLTYPSGFKIGNIISDYTGSSKEAALQNVLPITAASGMTYEIYPGTPAESVGAAWDELRADHTTDGSFGQYTLSQLTGTSAATIQGVQSVQTVQALASTVSVVLQPTTHTGAIIPTVNSVGTVNALASDVSVFLKPSVHTGATIPTVTVATGVSSAVSILAGTYSAVTVQAGSLAPSAVTTVVQSVLSGELGNGRTVREALWAMRNRVATDEASSVGTVYQTDDSTSGWTFSFTTSANGITGFDPAGP